MKKLIIRNVEDKEELFDLLKTHSQLRTVMKINFVICERCRRIRATQIHHIDKNRSNNIIENLKALCKPCHRRVHNRYSKGFNQQKKER